MNERQTRKNEFKERRERITRTSAENDIDIQRLIISRSDYEELCSINNEDTFDQNARLFLSQNVRCFWRRLFSSFLFSLSFERRIIEHTL